MHSAGRSWRRLGDMTQQSSTGVAVHCPLQITIAWKDGGALSMGNKVVWYWGFHLVRVNDNDISFTPTAMERATHPTRKSELCRAELNRPPTLPLLHRNGSLVDLFPQPTVLYQVSRHSLLL